MNPTSTAARPTKLCRIAIICGIWVISTRRAEIVPMTAPISSAPAISAAVIPAFCSESNSASSTVAANASTMPILPAVLPALAVFWCDRPARDRMNSTPAIT